METPTVRRRIDCEIDLKEMFDKTFQQLLELAKADDDVLGFILCGSRGKGFATENSDYDCAIIVKPEASNNLRLEIDKLPSIFEVFVFTLAEFEEHATWGSKYSWDRYNWAHLSTQVDKIGGKIQAIINEKGKIPEEKLSQFVSGRLDHYINQVYRSIKCFRDGNLTGFRFEAAESIPPVLDVLFAIHQRRLRPYYKYLEWELTEFPLTKLGWNAEELLIVLQNILADGSKQSQQKLFVEVERVTRSCGYGEVFDNWGDKLNLIG